LARQHGCIALSIGKIKGFDPNFNLQIFLLFS